MQRQTRQREAIQRAFRAADRPLSPQELHGLAAAALPSLNLATVYRTIRELLGDGAIARVELPGEASRYELAGKAHHHHFHCRRCDRVYELAGCAVGGAGAQRMRSVPRGFQMEGHELIVWGTCADCNRAPTAAARASRTRRKQAHS